jgi:hypothetical protein
VLDQHVQRLCGKLSGLAHAIERLGPMQLDLVVLARLAARHVEVGHASLSSGAGSRAATGNI